jgi:hypothetical protein
MKTVICAFLSLAALRADSVVCIFDSKTVPCTSLTDLGVLEAPGSASFTVSPQTIVASNGGDFEGSGPPYKGYNTVEFSFDDSLRVPATRAGDVFQIFADGEVESEFGSNWELDGFGMTAGPFTVNSWLGCDDIACHFIETIPADQISTVRLYGSGFFSAGPDDTGPSALGFAETITLELRKADGITPDTFIPEPSSLVLVGLALLPTIFAVCRPSIGRREQIRYRNTDASANPVLAQQRQRIQG